MYTQDSTTILLVEDDVRLADLIKRFFKDQDFSIEVEHRGDTAIKRIVAEQPDLVILDIMLPGASGFDVCRETRSHYQGLILMLTAKDDDVDQIVGLEMGADDYVTKPVEPRVLLARVRALLRRNVQKPEIGAAEKLEFGELLVNGLSREVTLAGVSAQLTTMEFDLVWLLASEAGNIVSRDWLFKRLRGLEYDGLDRSVDIAVSRLRRKLGDTDNPAVRIKTVRGKGYLFVPDAW